MYAPVTANENDDPLALYDLKSVTSGFIRYNRDPDGYISAPLYRTDRDMDRTGLLPFVVPTTVAENEVDTLDDILSEPQATEKENPLLVILPTSDSFKCWFSNRDTLILVKEDIRDYCSRVAASEEDAKIEYVVNKETIEALYNAVAEGVSNE